MKNRTKQLEEAIQKRNELIYSMMLNSHGYQHFMLNETVGVDELRAFFRTDEVIQRKIAQERIKLLNDDIK